MLWNHIFSPHVEWLICIILSIRFKSWYHTTHKWNQAEEQNDLKDLNVFVWLILLPFFPASYVDVKTGGRFNSSPYFCIYFLNSLYCPFLIFCLWCSLAVAGGIVQPGGKLCPFLVQWPWTYSLLTIDEVIVDVDAFFSFHSWHKCW